MKLLIIDDHPLLREGLSALLQRANPNAAILQAQGGTEGLTLAEDHRDLDAVLLDIAMPGINGLDVLAALGRLRPALPVLVVSSSEDPADIRRALGGGALGYVPKSASPQTILAALQLVLAGEVYIPPVMLHQIAPHADGVSGGRQAVARLTERQTEVLTLLARGLSNKEISEALNLSEKTVKAHISAIFRTLNVTNRTQAAGIARQAALV